MMMKIQFGERLDVNALGFWYRREKERTQSGAVEGEDRSAQGGHTVDLNPRCVEEPAGLSLYPEKGD